MDYPLKPNICNLDAHMHRPEDGALWPAEPETSTRSTSLASETGNTAKASDYTPQALQIGKKSPLYQLRWVTLGYHYNWDTKEYCPEQRSPFPADLACLSSFILDHVGFAG